MVRNKSSTLRASRSSEWTTNVSLSRTYSIAFASPVLLCIKSTIGRLVPASTNLSAPVRTALADVSHFKTPEVVIKRLVWILELRQISGKGQFLTPVHVT